MGDSFFELAIGSVSQRGAAVAAPHVGQYIAKAQLSRTELYRSYYAHDEAIVEHLKKYKTIKTYKGNYYIKELLLDVDKGDSSDQAALDKARYLFEVLENDFVSDGSAIHVWYSGRGYHLTFPDVFGFKPSKALPQILAATFKKHFPMCDPKIYHHAGLIRVGQTINKKSNLFKVPLTPSEFFSGTVESIQQIAVKPREFLFPSHDELNSHPEQIVVPTMESQSLTVGTTTHSPDAPSAVVTCMQKLFVEGGHEGARHEGMLRLASAWRRAGLPQSAVVFLMKEWSPTLDQEEATRIVRSVFEKGYRYGCNDIVMARHCDSRCMFFKKKNFMVEIMEAKDVEKRFASFIRSDVESRAFNLADHFRLPNDFWFFPGEYITVMGDTGLGKTAWVQELVVNLAPKRVLYLSLEVHDLLLYRRFVQIRHNMTKEDVIRYYANNDNHLSDELDHIKIVTVAPQLNAIRTMIASTNPHVVVVDVIDGINVPFKRDGDKIEPIILELKAIAQQLETIIIGIHHISKQAANVGTLNVHSGKGSSAVEQKSDKVIGIEGQQTDVRRIIRSMKARDEKPFRIVANMNPDTFKFEQVDF